MTVYTITPGTTIPMILSLQPCHMTSSKAPPLTHSHLITNNTQLFALLLLALFFICYSLFLFCFVFRLDSWTEFLELHDT